MSYFRPIDTTLGEEQVELSRKEKLKCVCWVLKSARLGLGGKEGDSRGRSLGPYSLSLYTAALVWPL